MNTLLKRIVAFAAIALLWSSQASAVLIVIENSDGSATGAMNGDTITIEIWARDLDGEPVAAYDLDVLYDALLTVGNVVFGNLLGEEAFFEVFNDAILDVAGIVDAAQLSLLDDADLLTLQGGADFVLFTVDFLVAGLEGMGDFEFDILFNEFNDVKCSDNRVCAPDQVPEPGTLALLGLGLFAMAASRRRRKMI